MSIKILKLEGEPRERGLQIGNESKEMIINSFNRVLSLIENGLGVNNIEEMLKDIIKKSKLKKQYKNGHLHYGKNLKLSQKLSKWINSLFAFQCQDEINVIIKSLGIDLGTHSSAFGCGKTVSIPSIVAQTYDWQCFHDIDDIVILRVKHRDSSFEMIIPTIHGLKYLCGINDQSIGVCVNALCSHLNYSLKGLPVPYVTRALVEQST